MTSRTETVMDTRDTCSCSFGVEHVLLFFFFNNTYFYINV